MKASSKKSAPVIAPTYGEIAAFTGEKLAADAAEAWDVVSDFCATHERQVTTVGLAVSFFAVGYLTATSF